MLSHLFVLKKSKNFTSSSSIRIPPNAPFENWAEPKATPISSPFHIVPCYYIHNHACFKHSNFLKIISAGLCYGTVKWRKPPTLMLECPLSKGNTRSRNTTTNVLTATTLKYAIGAGITAAAGTRLSLQWLLVWRFNTHPFQLRNHRLLIATARLYLPWSGLGNLRACCLP
jgi:hypothetical protein